MEVNLEYTAIARMKRRIREGNGLIIILFILFILFIVHCSSNPSVVLVSVLLYLYSIV